MDEKNENTVTKKVTFPMRIWCDFEDQARRKYGDCYWLAIKDMMEKSKVFENIDLIRTDILNIYQRLIILEEKSKVLDEIENEDNNEEKTLGDTNG